MIPLKDDNPISSRPIVTYFLIGLCVVVFLMQLGSQSYRTGQLFYSYGLIPSVLMGHDQLPMDLYAVPAYLTIFSSMFVVIIIPPMRYFHFIHTLLNNLLSVGN